MIQINNFWCIREELNQENQRIKNICEVTYKLYVEDFDTIQADTTFYEGTSLYPPVSLMIEWMDEINMCYANRYKLSWVTIEFCCIWLTIIFLFYGDRLINAKHLLEIFNYSSQSVTNLQNMLDPKTNFSTVDAIMAKMSIFLLEK